MNRKTLAVGFMALAFPGLIGCGDSTPDPNGVPDKVAQLNCEVSHNKVTDAVSVTNKDTFPYKNCMVHLNESGFMDNGYMSKSSTIAPGQTQEYQLSDFAKSDGTRFQISETKIVEIDVETKNDGGFLTGTAILTPTN